MLTHLPDPGETPAQVQRRPIIENIVMLIAFWFGCALTMYAYVFVIMGWAAFILGASNEEFLEHFDMLSVPLGWVNRAFVIRPGRSFLAVCGIVLCNSYFYALILLPIYKFVHAALRRNRVIQLRINLEEVSEEREE